MFRRRLGALVDSVVATELVQDICTGKEPAEYDVGKLRKLLFDMP